MRFTVLIVLAVLATSSGSLCCAGQMHFAYGYGDLMYELFNGHAGGWEGEFVPAGGSNFGSMLNGLSPRPPGGYLSKPADENGTVIFDFPESWYAGDWVPARMAMMDLCWRAHIAEPGTVVTTSLFIEVPAGVFAVSRDRQGSWMGGWVQGGFGMWGAHFGWPDLPGGGWDEDGWASQLHGISRLWLQFDGVTRADIDNVVVMVTPVPEPASLAMLVGGLASGLVAWMVSGLVRTGPLAARRVLWRSCVG